MLNALQHNWAIPLFLESFKLLPRMSSTTEDLICLFPGSEEDVVFDLLLVLLHKLAAKGWSEKLVWSPVPLAKGR